MKNKGKVSSLRDERIKRLTRFRLLQRRMCSGLDRNNYAFDFRQAEIIDEWIILGRLIAYERGTTVGLWPKWENT